MVSRAFLVFQAAAMLACSNAFTLPQGTASSKGFLSRKMTAEDTESFDKFPVTTKTNKQLIFDENQGRFFETSLEPDTPYVPASKQAALPPTSSYDIPAEFLASEAFSSNEMVPTEILFGRTRKPTQEEEEELPELVEAVLDSAEAKPTPSPIQSTAPVQKVAAEQGVREVEEELPELITEKTPTPSPIQASEAFSSNEMVPTEILFGRTQKSTQEEEEEEELPELIAAAVQTATPSPIQSTVFLIEPEQAVREEELPELIVALESSEIKSIAPPVESIVPVQKIEAEQGVREEEELPEQIAEKKPSPSPILFETAQSAEKVLPEQAAAISVVEQCYAAWNQRDFGTVADCFDEELEYQDSQFLGKITTQSQLKQHFENQAKLLPPNSKLVLENIAVNPSTGNIGTQWYVQVGGSRVPFTRGCSFYQTNKQSGLIQSGFRVSEMIVKPSRQAADRLVSSASRLTSQSAPGSVIEKASAPTATASIIEQYFEAWNRRDMESALDCFVEDCVYQTEDPVFVDTLRGKAALKAHLEKNAKSLPTGCRIVLDHTAVDSARGTIGTMWHLEVNGIAIPNLRGCSMYTTKDGLLKSGFDVTEAPVKIPRQFLAPTQLLSLPARVLFGRQ